MKKINKKQFLEKKEFYLSEMKIWKVFVYPTDTVLGIWCIVNCEQSIEKIIELKKRENKFLLIIVPDIEWINENCIVNEEDEKYIEEKLPWEYSFVLELKHKNILSKNITNNTQSVGVRIPNNWFAEIISEIWVPFVTTSVNISWEKSVLEVQDIPESIMKWVDYVVSDDEKKSGKSSTLIDLRGENRVILRK